MARDLWARQLSRPAREVWASWPEPRRERAITASRAGEVEDDPDGALVIGEMQLISGRPFTGRSLKLLVGGWAVFYVVQAIGSSPWWLLGLVAPLLLGWQARRMRPTIEAGVVNLRHAGASGHPIAYRYRERFDGLASTAVDERH